MWYKLPKLLLFLFAFTTFSSIVVLSSATPHKLSYSDHCASTVPESTPTRYASFYPSVLSHTGYYAGGCGIRSPEPSYLPNHKPPNPIELNAWSVKETDVQDLFMVQGSLQFRTDTNHMENIASHLPQSSIRFALSGFWSDLSGRLCMVGSGSIYSNLGDLVEDAPALLKLHNFMTFTSVTSLVSGTLESLTSQIHPRFPSYFEPISIMMLPRINYQYTLVSEESDVNRSFGESYVSAGSLQMEKFCSIISGVVPIFYLQYSSHCLSTYNCTTPLSGTGIFPSIVALRGIECSEDDRRLRVLVEFADWRKRWYQMTFDPNATLVGEGSWYAEKNQLQVVACHFLDATYSFNNSQVGDCSISMSLTFPGVWTIGDTNNAAGYIWSNTARGESGYVEKITFGSLIMPYDGSVQLSGQKYEYTQIEKVAKLCPREKNTAATNYNTKRYPNPYLNDRNLFSTWPVNIQGSCAPFDLIGGQLVD